MGGTLTRDEWLKLREGADTPRGVGNTVIPLAHQMTEEERLGDFWAAWKTWNEKHALNSRPSPNRKPDPVWPWGTI